MAYGKLKDGEPWEAPAGKRFRLACCDCGLVHNIVIVAGSRKTVTLAMARNKRATAGRRRNKRVKANIAAMHKRAKRK